MTAGRACRMMADVTRRAVVLLLGVVMGLLGVVVGPAAPAAAHAVLSSTVPAKDSIVDEAPTQVVLTFSEAVTPIEGRIRVIGPDGERADTGEPRAVGNQLVIPLKPNGPQGTYLVTFRVISADSHPVSGTFAYSVGVLSNLPSADDADAESSPLVTVAFPVARWIGYLGLILLVGAAFILTMLWPTRLDRAGPTRMIWLGAGLVALATLAELALQVPYVAGSDVRASDVREVLTSQYGAAHLVRLGVLAAALVVLRPVVRGRGWAGDRILLAVLGTLAVATWSISGHPTASSMPIVTVTADMIHLGAMSVWLGGLVVLFLFLLRAASDRELSAIVPVWSRWATYAVVALVATGVAQAIIQVGSVDGLTSTTYGRVLLLKTALVVAVMAVAGLSRRLVAPIAQMADGAPRRLRTRVVAEAVGAVLVVAVASVLVQTTPARSASSQITAPTVQSAVLRDKLFTLTVDLQPGVVGLNDVHLYATTPDGARADVKEWIVRASQPERDIEPIDALILPITPDHAVGQISLPTEGQWTFSFTIRTTDIDQSTVTTTFAITR